MLRKGQRILLKTLLEHGGGASKLCLMKWLFLMRQETCMSDQKGFYDFVPYDYGPFSFSVYRDLAELQGLGLVEQNRRLVHADETAIEEVHVALPRRLCDAVRHTLDTYGDIPQADLLDYVYSAYPWYSIRSRAAHGSVGEYSRPAGSIYTIGYEGMTIDRFLNLLIVVGMKGLIDVRRNPVSRKYGFAKNTLARLCAKVSLVYDSFPELGIPASYRTDIETFDESDYRRLWDLYETEIADAVPLARKSVIELVKKRPSAILCFESDAVRCHRGRLSRMLSAESGLEVVHLAGWEGYGREGARPNHCEDLSAAVAKL